MASPSTIPDPAPSSRRPFPLQLGLALVVALLLWGYGIETRSLWFDEFHSFHHDRQPNLAAFFESVRSDNHPPLSFLLQRASLAAFGESELALRLPALLSGLGLLILTWHVGRRLPQRAGRTAALWIVAFSSFCFDIYTEARMYGLLCLSVLGLMEGVLSGLDGKRSRWLAALWVFIGLHAHYYFLHNLLLVGAAFGALVLASPDARRRLSSVAVPVLVGCLSFVPWAVWGFWAQLHHGLPPGGGYRGANALLQSLGHLLYLNASAGGAIVTYGVALPGLIAGAVLGLLGLQRLWNARRDPTSRYLLLFALVIAFGVPLWSIGISLVYERASYGWRYIAGSVVPLALLIGVGMAGRELRRRLLGGAFLASLAAVTLVVALDGGRENYRAAVGHILRAARPGDAVLTRALWEKAPEHSPTGWGFYALRVVDQPTQFLPTEIRLEERERAFEFQRVWVYTRDLRHLYILDDLRQHFEHERVWPKGKGMVLHLFWNGPYLDERVGISPNRRPIDSVGSSH